MNLKQICVAFTLTAVSASSQTVAPARPEFEVATIKPNADGGRGSKGIRMTPGPTVTMTNMTAQSIIAFAYDVKADQISGGPKWVASDSYDIVGKAPGIVPTPDKLKLLFQALLTDRLGLTFHRETKEMPVYLLTVAKTGLKIKETLPGSCTPIDLSHMPPPPAPGQPPPNFCGALRMSGGLRNRTLNAVGIGMTKAAGGTMGLASALTDAVGRPVIDHTGLTGIFDFRLEWTPDDRPDSDPGSPASPAENSGPSIFTALQEQLGLRLEPGKGPVEVVVIDNVQRPSEN